MLRTRLTEMFGLDYPVMSAPMALHSGGTLAAAVSAAGGLGSFGGIHPVKGPEWIKAEIAGIRAVTDRPFAVGWITPFLPFAARCSKPPSPNGPTSSHCRSPTPGRGSTRPTTPAPA
jgi:NAD(P)H-dependent flavin oxidoreductase YrpB (nitropropane dioxygenase family)